MMPRRPIPMRQTIADAITFEGVGLHSGMPVRARLLPAEVGSGIVFVRRDVDGLTIPATLAQAGPSFYATVLERDGHQVSTIEHLMAALYALQIDDLRVEIDAGELPILDGSARPFVDAIARVGCVDLALEREYMTLIRPIVVSDQEKRIAAYPSHEFRVTYAIDFEHPLVGYQELSVRLWHDNDFRDKLSAARTFTFEQDVEQLRRRGLALGGSLDNALVIGEDRILNPELRYPDEFVRHKMLDLTGDLSLLGRPLRAHIVAYRAGHDLHGRLARRIWEAKDAWYLASGSERPVGSDFPADA